MATELDEVLMVVENQIRRKIIQKLSQEPNYPLKLAGELGVQQQLVAKHLRVMEEAELVESETKSSRYGPDRRMYNLAKSLSVTIDFSPGLYSTRIFSFEDASIHSKHQAVSEFRERLEDLSARDKGLAGINLFADLIADIDKRIAELENERVNLLYFRRLAMSAAKKRIQGRDISLIERLVIQHIRDKKKRTRR